MSSPDSILQTVFGLQRFRPQQREIIQDVLDGHDVVCVMPTGAGKSLCFQLPAVILRGLTIVVSPLISLMADQVAHLRRLRIPTMLLNSSLSGDEQRKALAVLHNGYRGMLYIAPERFAAPSFQNLLPKLQPNLFVVDEAHCVSFWGHDFRPEYMNLAEVRKALGSPVTMSLTATATPQVRRDIVEMLGLRSPKMHVTGFDRPNLAYSCRRLESEHEKDDALLRFLTARKNDGGIVYCSTRKNVEALAALLEEQFPDRTVCAYHAGMDNPVRKNSQSRFMADPNSIAVATNAFGMGINKPNIRYVVHYNLPGSVEAYYQEAGRAGRDGDPAACLLYFGTRDLKTQEFFIDKIGDNNEALKSSEIARLQDHSRKKLDAMWSYANKHRCRRRQILDYFGESTPVANCKCDQCAHPINGMATSSRATQRWESPKPVLKAPTDALRFATRSKPKKVAKAALSTEPLSPQAEARFERLKKVRRQLADKHQWPAFCIMHDSTLMEVARRAPSSVGEFAEIKGIGDKKAVHFGPAFLKVLQEER
jgi:ATP-dependent DNA helicase RecQ